MAGVDEGMMMRMRKKAAASVVTLSCPFSLFTDAVHMAAHLLFSLLLDSV